MYKEYDFPILFVNLYFLKFKRSKGDSKNYIPQSMGWEVIIRSRLLQGE